MVLYDVTAATTRGRHALALRPRRDGKTAADHVYGMFTDARDGGRVQVYPATLAIQDGSDRSRPHERLVCARSAGWRCACSHKLRLMCSRNTGLGWISARRSGAMSLVGRRPLVRKDLVRTLAEITSRLRRTARACYNPVGRAASAQMRGIACGHQAELEALAASVARPGDAEKAADIGVRAGKIINITRCPSISV